MLPILGGLAGFASSFVPELFHFLKDKKDKDHELKLINLQIEAMKAGHSSRLEEVQIQAEALESKYLYLNAKPSQIKWVDAMSAAVRPMITYTMFMLYTSMKIIDFLKAGAMAPIWTDADQGLFCAVMGFWFGHRSLRHKSGENGRNGYY